MVDESRVDDKTAEDKFDVIIVGGGISGCCCAYLLAQSGLDVLLIERGNFAGAKNISGGRLYSHSIEKIFPDFAQNAPVERVITREKIVFLDETRSTAIDFTSPLKDDIECRSYSVLRGKLDPWLCEQAENAGSMVVTGVKVDELLVRAEQVCGVIAGGEEMEANVVVLADGVNSLLAQQLGLVEHVDKEHCAIGVKEIIELSPDIIDERFNCHSNEGTASLFIGMPSAGEMGGGFLYTNKNTLSLGLVCGLHHIGEAKKSVPQMLEDFKCHPSIAPLIKGGKTVEYAAHLVPEGGLNMVPKLASNGVVLIGDTAGFCLNVGYTIRGMDLAVESARCAAEAIIESKNNHSYNEKGLSGYQERLSNSFIMKDLKLYQKAPNFLNTPRLFNQYPVMVNGILDQLFTIKGTAQPMRKIVTPHLKRVGFINLLKDGFNGGRSL